MNPRPRILVIKLGALGDLVQALGPAAAIRLHHADAEIVLLTSDPFAGFLADAPYFDEIWIDARPGWRNPLGLLAPAPPAAGGAFHPRL